MLGGDVRTFDGVLVPVLDEEPLGLALLVAASANQHPGAAQPLALQHELEVALLISSPYPSDRIRIAAAVGVGTPVPQHHRTASVLALGNGTLEAVVLDGMVFHLHGEALDRGVEAGALGNSPTLHHPIQLEP